ncbi:MAG: hypothetical protein EON52_10980 [Actinomycetales bacterium]|nr:MAG: hypothetical protein EON52_10980 [Actinomycetales bacterium]
MTPRPLRSRAPELVAALLLAVLCAACGSEEAAQDGPGSGKATEVQVSIRTAPGDQPERVLLVCGSDAGCAELKSLDARVLEPVDGTKPCTQLYGGPEVVTLTGTIDRKAVNATFSRTDGCEIERYDAVRPLLKAVGLD